MSSNHFNLGRRKTLGIEPKNEEKVFIKIPLENGGFWEREYFQNDLIGNVINDFKAENHVDIPQDYFMDWNCKNKSLKMTDKIKTLIVPEIPTICFNAEMKKKPLEIQEEEIIPKIVAKPFSNPFEIFLFNKRDKILKIQTFDENTIENLSLNDYNSSSTYCNGNNNLFISGGEKRNNEIINKFWEIDLENNFIKEPILIPPKKDHGMIFIPPGYVFMVGGNNKKTFFYDTKNQEICEWADLNMERTEPALQRIDNILYCFDNVNKANNSQLTFEKTELNSKNPKWTLIYPKFDSSLSKQKLPQKFFGVAKDADNNIVFLGGNMDYYTDGNKLNNYKYNPFNNLIEPSDVPYREYNFKEKTFLPYNKNIDYILPDFNKQHPEIVFYVKNKSKVEKVNYKPNLGINKKNVLRGARRPLFDSKYDFNMPSISIPSNFNDNININENIKLKAGPPKYESPYASKDIHEPSFQEYNFNSNLKIEQPPPFKEPEIEANKGDQRLSIEIPNNIILSSREKETVKDKNNINLNEEKKSENKNAKLKLNYIPRPPQEYNRNIYTNMNLENNELVIPKFHYSVNDPGNELNITRRGKIITSYVPIPTSNIKSSYADINIKSSKLEKDDLIIPNYNYSVNLAMDTESRKKTPNKSPLTARNMNIRGNLDGDILTPNIHMPKTDNINLGNVKLNSPEYKLEPGFTFGMNGPTGKINLEGLNNPDFELSGIIKGKNPKFDLKGPKIKTPEYNLSGRIPGTKIKGADINLKGPNINGPDFKLNGEIPGININGPKIDLKSPNLDINGPNIDKPNINLKGPNMNGPDFNLCGKIKGIDPKIDLKSPNIDLKGPNLVKGPNIDVKTPNIDLKGPNIDLKEPNLDIKGPNIDLKTPNIGLKGPNIDLKEPNLDIKGPNIDLKGPNIKGPDFNLSGKIPGIDIEKPKIDLKGPDFNLDGSIKGIDVNAPKIELPSGNINLRGPNIKNPDINLEGSIPGIKVNTPKIDLPKPNIKVKGPKIKGSDFKLSGFIPGIRRSSSNLEVKGPRHLTNYSLNAKIPDIGLKTSRMHIHSPDIDIKGSRRIPDDNLYYNSNLSGIIPGINIKGSHNVNLPSGNINLKGYKIGGSGFNLNGDIPGLKINPPNLDIKGDIKGSKIKSPDINLKGNIPGIKLNAPKVDLKGSNLNINSPNIKSPDINLKGNIPGIKLNAPKVDLKSPNLDINGPNIKGPDLDIKGDIPGIKLDTPKVDLKGPNLDINGPNIKSPDLNIKGDIPGIKLNAPKVNLKSPNLDINGPNIKSPDLNIKGVIPGLKIDVPKVDIKSPNLDLKGPEYNLSGDIKGINVNAPKIDLPSGDIKLKGPNIKGKDFNLQGSIPGVKLNGPKIDLNTPNINIDGNNPDFTLSGLIPGSKSYNAKLNVNGPSINANMPSLDIKGSQNYNLSGNIPGVKLNAPKVDLKPPNLDINGPNIKGPEYNLKGYIQGLKINVPKVDIKYPNTDFKGQNYNYNLSGDIKGINVNRPKMNIPSGNVRLRGPKIKTPQFELNGNIPGKNIKDQDYFLSGVIPSYKLQNPNIEIKNYKINGPDIKYSTIEPDINNESHRKLKASFNLRGISPGKKAFHGNLNDPNYLDFSDIKGSRRQLFNSQINLDQNNDISKRIDKNNINVSGVKIIDEQDVILQDPYNMYGNISLQAQNAKRKSINLVVSHLEIQPEQEYNQIKVPQPNINIQTPKIKLEQKDINIEKNLEIKGGDIDINMNNNINVENTGKIDLKLDNDKKNLGNINIKLNNEGNENFHIVVPKVEIKSDLEQKIDLPNVNVEKPEEKIKMNKKGVTNLRFKPINDDEENKKFGINLKAGMKKIDENNDSSNEESNSRALNSERGNLKKKGKGLPKVGIKDSNFKTSKIDVAGKLNVNDIDVNNMKSANIGVNGTKMGERIIE